MSNFKRDRNGPGAVFYLARRRHPNFDQAIPDRDEQRLAKRRLFALRKRQQPDWSWLAIVLVLGLAGGLFRAGDVYAAPDPGQSETRTETRRALLGGLWEKHTVTTTTARVSLDDVDTGSLLFKTDKPGEYIEAPRLDTAVSIDVTGIVARVVVTQSFANPSGEWAEGLYAFPLPEDSAVDTLRMRVGEQVIEGEIMERAQAKRAYTQAKEEGARASLIEQTRPNLFKTAVANISPRDTVYVEIGYLETLDYSDGKFSLRLPMTITPRYDPGTVEMTAGMMSVPEDLLPGSMKLEPAAMASVSPLSESLAEVSARINAGFPLRTLASKHHEVDVEKDGSVYRLSLRDGAVPMDRDFELSWEPAIGAEPGAAVFTEELDGETYALLMFMPPQVGQGGQGSESVPRLARETIIVIDTSGSMAGASFEQARDAVRFALGRLDDRDFFNIVRFSSDMDSLYTSAQPATAGNLAAAITYLDRLNANGGTNMAPALEVALDPRSGSGLLRQVVFVTDGAVSNERELFALIDRDLGDTRLFTVGIGSAPNSFFMRKAAETGRGTYSYIGSAQEVREEMTSLFAKLEAPVLKDIEVDWPAGVAEAWPKRTPDLYQKEPLIVSAKLTGMPGELAISGTQAGKGWKRALPMTKAAAFDGVSTLWARNKVGSLMDGLHKGESVDSIRARVVPLALRHRLVTRFTSLVAVDTTPVRPQTAQLREHDIPNTAPAGARTPVLSKGGSAVPYPAGATPATLNLIIGLMLLMFAALGRAWFVPTVRS